MVPQFIFLFYLYIIPFPWKTLDPVLVNVLFYTQNKAKLIFLQINIFFRFSLKSVFPPDPCCVSRFSKTLLLNVFIFCSPWLCKYIYIFNKYLKLTLQKRWEDCRTQYRIAAKIDRHALNRIDQLHRKFTLIII